jgi:hypothetical protein
VVLVDEQGESIGQLEPLVGDVNGRLRGEPRGGEWRSGSGRQESGGECTGEHGSLKNGSQY